MAWYEARVDEQRDRQTFRACAECAGGEACVGRSYRGVPPADSRAWPVCPDRLIRSPAWRAIVRRWEASKVAPLEGWPSAYLAWAVEAIAALDLEMHKAARERAERAAKGGKSPHGPIDGAKGQRRSVRRRPRR